MPEPVSLYQGLGGVEIDTRSLPQPQLGGVVPPLVAAGNEGRLGRLDF